MASDLHRHRDGSWFLDARFWGCVMGGYTKGPWFVTYTRNGTANVGPSHNCTIAALLMAPAGEMEDDARLIAAAPELLELAEKCASECAECNGCGLAGGHIGQTPENFDYVSEPCEACADIRAVIAKATGEQA